MLTGEDAHHICRALRMRRGEEITLCDTRGYDYFCRLEEVAPGEVRARVLGREASKSESRARITLYQALPKGDKLEFIVQKATELGACEVVPVLTGRCVSRPDAKTMEGRRRRLQKIALEAAKQSGRGKIPEIAPLLSFSEAIGGMKQAECAILCYEEAATPLFPLLLPEARSFALMVGSEGGFSPQEAQSAAENGIPTASLGRRILRCETASVAALSALLCRLGEI